MNQLKLGLRLESEYKTKFVSAWLDTGFNGSLIINHNLAQKLQAKALKRIKVGLGDNQSTQGILTNLNISITVDDKQLNLRNVTVLILENENQPVIGIGLLERIQKLTNLQAKLNVVKEEVKLVE